MSRQLRGAGWLLVAPAAVAAGWAVLYGLSGTVHLATRSRIVPPERLPHHDVALVLGAEVYANGTPSAFLRARLDLAAELYRRGLVERVLVSGDGRSRFYDETSTMRDYLVAAGVPSAALLADAAGLDTYDSCLRARDTFGLRELVVVSQSYHLPRALAICRALGIDAWGVGDDTVRSHRRTWAHGVRREVVANLKLVWDVCSGRPPAASQAVGQPPASAPDSTARE